MTRLIDMDGAEVVTVYRNQGSVRPPDDTGGWYLADIQPTQTTQVLLTFCRVVGQAEQSAESSN